MCTGIGMILKKNKEKQNKEQKKNGNFETTIPKHNLEFTPLSGYAHR